MKFSALLIPAICLFLVAACTKKPPVEIPPTVTPTPAPAPIATPEATPAPTVTPTPANPISESEMRQNPAGTLPLVIATGDRALLVHFLQINPRGLFWQEAASQRYLQALQDGDSELLQLLRAAHATPPRLPGSGQTLLAYAVAWNAPEKVRLLLESGASPDELLIPTREDAFLNLLNTPRLRKLVADDTGVTPLILAAGLGYGDVMKVLLQAGANRYATTKDHLGAVDFVGSQWDLLEPLLAVDERHLAPYRIEVDLSKQRAFYYEGNRMLMKCIISSGRKGFATPTGRFFVTDKDRSHVSSIYDVEMPYFMRFNGSAVGMHAGPTNGQPISHGCVRMPEEAAKWLFQHAPVGTLVTIKN